MKTGISRWILVTERLPENGDWVLVTVTGELKIRGIDLAYFSKNGWYGISSTDLVVAWMPLPEPYKEEKND